MRPTRPLPIPTWRAFLASGLAGGLAAGGLAVQAQSASAQQSVAPTLSRPSGGLGAPSGASGGTGLSNPYLTLPPGLAADGVSSSASPGPAGAGLRGRARRPATRRSRPPTVSPFQSPIRSTLIAPEVAANVQPPLTGIPDLDPPPVAARRRPLVEDPYAPLGIRTGGLTFFPAIGQAIGYDTNPNRSSANRRGSFVSQTEGELGLRSDWSRHELTGFVRGAYNAYPSNPEASRPEGAGRVGFRLDASRDTQFDVEGHYQIDTQRPDSPDLNAAVRERPIIYTEGASAGISHRFNRLVVGLRGTLDRADYEDAQLANGTILDQSDRNSTQYGARLRLGYELHPGFVPFVEVQGDTRVHDRPVDSAGFRRDSDGVGARIGTSFELGRLITGEISAGAINRTYADPRLDDLLAPVADASLAYALTPLTTVRATAQARVDETTIPNANGVRVLRGTLEVAHALRRNVTLTAGITGTDAEYSGVAITERSFGALLRADWRLNRQVALRASYNYEQLNSSLPNADYTANVFLLGLRLQP